MHPQDSYGLSKQLGEAMACSYTNKCDMETIVLRPPWVVAPAQMDELRRAGGGKPDRFRLYSYVDVRDAAEAFRLAVERPVRSHQVLDVCADDSRVAEPLCELLPRLLPALGDMARDLTGSRPAASNARAKAVLGWQPRRSWRRPDD